MFVTIVSRQLNTQNTCVRSISRETLRQHARNTANLDVFLVDPFTRIKDEWLCSNCDHSIHPTPPVTFRRDTESCQPTGSFYPVTLPGDIKDPSGHGKTLPWTHWTVRQTHMTITVNSFIGGH